jgi:hypothetical protein
MQHDSHIFLANRQLSGFSVRQVHTLREQPVNYWGSRRGGERFFNRAKKASAPIVVRYAGIS